MKLISGSYCRLQLLSVCGEKEEENLTNLQKYKAVNERDIRYIYKDIGGESGVTVGFKTKSLKAVAVKREILPRKLLKTIDKCKFNHENLEFISGSYCPLQLLSVCGEEEEKLQCCTPQYAQRVDIYTCV